MIKELRSVISECCTNMRDWGYQLPRLSWRTSHSKHWLGATSEIDTQHYLIELSNFLTTENVSKEFQKEIIYHEIAHAIEGCKTKHSKRWTKIVKDVNKRTGLNITPFINIQRMPLSYFEKNFPYLLRCEKCGEIIYFKSYNKILDNFPLMEYNNNCKYHHTHCGGKLFRIK